MPRRPQREYLAVNRMFRAEKWGEALMKMDADGVVNAEPTGGYGMQWKVSLVDNPMHIPAVYIYLGSGALVQGGQRIKGFGVDGVRKALCLDEVG